MARDAGARDAGARTPASRRGRPGGPAPIKPIAPVPAAAAAPAPPKPRVSPGQFAAEVRQEARKITWPSWKETWITSVMVFIMVTVTSAFFLITDGALSFILQQILKLAS